MVPFLAFEKACLCSRPTSLHAASGGAFWVSICFWKTWAHLLYRSGAPSKRAYLVWVEVHASATIKATLCGLLWLFLSMYVSNACCAARTFSIRWVRSQRVVLNKCLVCLGLRRMIARVTHADACRRRRSTHPRIARRRTRRRRSCQKSRNSELLAGVTNAPIWCHSGSQGRHRRHPSMSVGRSADCLCSHGREFEGMWPPCRRCRVSGMIVLGWWC